MGAIDLDRSLYKKLDTYSESPTRTLSTCTISGQSEILFYNFFHRFALPKGVLLPYVIPSTKITYKKILLLCTISFYNIISYIWVYYPVFAFYRPDFICQSSAEIYCSSNACLFDPKVRANDVKNDAKLCSTLCRIIYAT